METIYRHSAMIQPLIKRRGRFPFQKLCFLLMKLYVRASPPSHFGHKRRSFDEEGASADSACQGMEEQEDQKPGEQRA
ncbi:hypothetical protein MHZ93_24405 [Roseomonas sp. ACRSG]|nr:hypothetical protein [Roseomonas sp. ACRSG]